MSEATPALTCTALSGYELLADPRLHMGKAFSEEERDAFHLHGLLPPHVSTLDEQIFAQPRFDAVEAIVVTDGERILGLEIRGRRHGHAHRQARALFRLRRPASRDDPADPA